jgi:hypothetical protein
MLEIHRPAERGGPKADGLIDVGGLTVDQNGA